MCIVKMKFTSFVVCDSELGGFFPDLCYEICDSANEKLDNAKGNFETINFTIYCTKSSNFFVIKRPSRRFGGSQLNMNFIFPYDSARQDDKSNLRKLISNRFCLELEKLSASFVNPSTKSKLIHSIVDSELW